MEKQHPEKKYPLSVLVLTYNEEGRIDDCLKSVSWASDVIVLDDESTDKTEEIVKRYGTRFFRRKMENEGRHRNYGQSLAKEKWILSLDADERVTPELAQSIQTFVSNPGNQSDRSGCSMLRKNYIGDYWVRHGGWYTNPILKMFEKDKFKWDEDEVHPVARLDGPTKPLRGDIVHYSYRSFGDFVNKLNKQTTLEARKWFRTDRKIGLPKALRKTVDRFLRSYLMKKGYKDGFYGLMVAVFAGFYQILSYAKFRELQKG